MKYERDEKGRVTYAADLEYGRTVEVKHNIWKDDVPARQMRESGVYLGVRRSGLEGVYMGLSVDEAKRLSGALMAAAFEVEARAMIIEFEAQL